MICIDIFSKFMAVAPIESKQMNDVFDGLLQCLDKMGKTPKFIYSDDEAALDTTKIKTFLHRNNIQRIITRSHSHFAERAIRTLKNENYKRIDYYKKDNENQPWHDYIKPILSKYNYSKHSATGMTPHQARHPSNTLNVKLSMEIKAKRNRRYKELEVGDKVRIFSKRKPNEKERVNLYSDRAYEIDNTIESSGLKFYHVNNRDYQRNELLLQS